MKKEIISECVDSIVFVDSEKKAEENKEKPPATAANPELCEKHKERRLIFCEIDGFTCELCDCKGKGHKIHKTKDQKEDTIVELKKCYNAFIEKVDKNSSEELKKLILNLKDLDEDRKNKRAMLSKIIEGILSEDEENFRNKVNGLLKDLESMVEKLDNTSEEANIHAEKANKLYKELENTKSLAKIIEGYEYYTKEFPKLISKYPEYNWTKLERKVEDMESYKGDIDALKDYFDSYTLLRTEPKNNTQLYSVLNLTPEIISYDVQKKKSKKVLIEGSSKFPHFCGVAVKKSTLYIAGGTLDFVHHLSEVCEINMETKTEMSLQSLGQARSENTLVNIADYLICIGGRGKAGLISDIELLNIKNQSKGWEVIGKLEPPKTFVAALGCEENKKVYMFGGLAETHITKDMKAVKGLEVTSDLTVLNIIERTTENYKLEIPGVHSAGIICIDHKNNGNCSLLIMGGRTATGVDTNAVYLWENRSVKSKERLAQPDTFYAQQPVLTGTEVVLIGKKSLHFYEEGSKSKAVELHDWYTL